MLQFLSHVSAGVLIGITSNVYYIIQLLLRWNCHVCGSPGENISDFVISNLLLVQIQNGEPTSQSAEFDVLLYSLYCSLSATPWIWWKNQHLWILPKRGCMATWGTSSATFLFSPIKTVFKSVAKLAPANCTYLWQHNWALYWLHHVQWLQ